VTVSADELVATAMARRLSPVAEGEQSMIRGRFGGG
jgi:hypothetical protein